MPRLLTKRLVDDLVRSGTRSEVADSRTPGLNLRVNVRRSHFEFVWSPGGKKRRITLGLAGELQIDDARDLARKASDLVRQGYVPTEDWLRESRVVESEANNARPLETRKSTWTFEEARDAFLQHVFDKRKASTLRDYKDYLNRPELDDLRQRAVCDITDEDLSEILAKIHASGREGTAEGMKRKLSSMWTHLQRQHVRAKSGVRRKVQLDVPDRTPGKRREKRFPYPSELRKVLRKARAGDYGVASRPLVLLLLTGQRRETVVSVAPEDVADGIWHIPPMQRKTAAMRDDTRVHTIPWPSEITFEPHRQWVFQAYKRRRGKGARPHVSGSTLTHALKDETWSPHDVRRCLTTVLRSFGYKQDRIALILDHNEGGGSVIDEHYDAYEDMPEKREMLEAWWDVLEERRKIDEKAVFKSRNPPKRAPRYGVKDR